ncbi:WAT1-related protein At1g44800-like [Triticum urartu]|uniref:WAT1-related protein n=2 Tax=Triticum urartu TaxID=4572 RepID=A0A8R7R9I5_TRIUA|nr:WAT1-related protein At1g44800-like [Triticum dicoccoides]XP_048540132.1 WAT1-related protein At1g44800-like [Triticum urartu]
MELVGSWRKVMPYMAMVFLQFGYAGLFLLSVASLRQGMSHYVLVVYRNAIAAAAMAPFALWFERKTRRKMTLSLFYKIVALALLEPVLDQNFFYIGARNTSASFSSALTNVLPAVTFVNAILIRMERINIKERRSQAKIAGTVITVGGALLMVLFRGPVLNFPWTKHAGSHVVADTANHSSGCWLLGIVMILLSSFCWSAFFILQSHTLRSYPSELSLTTMICVMGVVQSGVVALVMERDTKAWAIGFDMRLVTAAYSGIMCSGVAYYLQGIVIQERGPVFVTAFCPLCMIIVTVLGSFILSEVITLGRITGAMIIVVGLYALIWGKSKDHVNQVERNDNFEKHNSFELPFTTTTITKASNLDMTITVAACSKESPMENQLTK